jgi:predicted Zn finger-like uncharacterized protein
MYEYKCPGCATVLKSAQPAPAGKQIRCKACGTAFTPRAESAPRPGTAAPVKKQAAAQPVAAQPTAAPPTAANRDDGEGPVTAYGVIKEEDTEAQKAAKKTISFSGVHDKGRRSARGPAMSLLVFPSNLLIAEGALTFIGGLGVFIWAMWPLVFTDVPPSDEEVVEQAVWMGFGLMLIGWGCLVCIGASKMQNLESYTWAMVGAVLGILPVLVGIFAIAMLRNPKVVAGFEEIEGAIDDEEEDEEGDDEDEDDEDEDEDDD